MDEKKADYLYNMIINSKKECDMIKDCSECPRDSQPMCLSHKIADDLAADPCIKVIDISDARLPYWDAWERAMDQPRKISDHMED